MIRVSLTKISLKAEDLAEYEREKANWNLSKPAYGSQSRQNSAVTGTTVHRAAVGARLGIARCNSK